MSNQVATTKNTVQSILESEAVKSRIEDILGKRASTFASSVIQISRSNALLQKAEPNSIVASAITAATLNLPLNNSLGYAYIIPFNERQKDTGNFLTKAQFQIGYKGFIQLAQRSGTFKTVNVSEVKQGEIESRDRLTGEITFNWNQNDVERNKLKSIGYVAYFSLTNGFEKSMFMSMEDLQKHGKKFSQTFKKGFGLWNDDFDSMAKKTVLKLLLSKYAPLSIDMQNAVIKDQASFDDVNDLENPNYIDNKKPEKVDEERKRTIDFINEVKDQKALDYIKSQIDVEDKVFAPLLRAKELEINK